MNPLDLIFPKNCLECKTPGSYICERCIAKVRLPKPICPKCEKASIDGFTHTKCKRKYGMDGLLSIWNYEGVVRRAIIALKYKYVTDIVSLLNGYIVEELKKREVLVPSDYNASSAVPSSAYCLVPIPMHWYRENSRGFNQSLELGKLIAREMSWKFVPDLLSRKRLNTPQAKLSGKERKENIKGVFSLNPSYQLLATNYILFDDVYTTGSTLKEAAKVLKRKRIASVWGLTIAR